MAREAQPELRGREVLRPRRAADAAAVRTPPRGCRGRRECSVLPVFLRRCQGALKVGKGWQRAFRVLGLRGSFDSVPITIFGAPAPSFGLRQDSTLKRLKRETEVLPRSRALHPGKSMDFPGKLPTTLRDFSRKITEIAREILSLHEQSPRGSSTPSTRTPMGASARPSSRRS